MKQFDVELKVNIKMNTGESPPEDVRLYSGLDIKELTHMERQLMNVMLKLNKFSEDRAHGRALPAAPSNDNKGTVFFSFIAKKQDGSLFASQTNEWPGMGQKEIAFMTGLFEGELSGMDKGVSQKGKKGRGFMKKAEKGEGK